MRSKSSQCWAGETDRRQARTEDQKGCFPHRRHLTAFLNAKDFARVANVLLPGMGEVAVIDQRV